MIPSIEYLRGRGPDYRIVAGIAIASDGPVASVALFTTVPLNRIRSIAADISSRTSNALAARALRGAVRDRARLSSRMPPDLAAMLSRCDAALLIGDPALFLDHEALGVQKIDLGEQWTRADGAAVRVGVLGGASGRPLA